MFEKGGPLILQQLWAYYLGAILGLYLIFGTTQNINDRFDKGIIVTNKKLRRFLWIKKIHEHISYPSLVFVIIGYFYTISLPACSVACLLVSEPVIMRIYFFIVFGTWVVEIFFIPSYGARGS